MKMVALLVSVVSALCCGAMAQDILATYRGSDAIDILDRTNASVVSSVTMTHSSLTIIGTNGLAIHPTTGTFYVVLRDNTSARTLCTVDRASGACTTIGTLAENVASIAFDDTGTLYAVTGDGAATPETLFTVNTSTAAMTLFLTLGNGNDGEVIAFNPDDGLMYHLSGITAPITYESIDLNTQAITPIINSLATDEFTALTYDASGTFFVGNRLGGLSTLSTTGNAIPVGFVAGSAVLKGLVVIPSVATTSTSVNLGTTIAGASSTPVSFDLSGSRLINDIVINTPTGVEVSLTNSGGYGSTLNIPPTNGSVPTTTIFVRIQASAPVGPIAGNLDITTTAADAVQVAVAGQVDPPDPEMDVLNGATPIADGSTDTLGMVAFGPAQSLTYQIENNGTTPLTFGGAPTVVLTAGTNVQNLSVVAAPSTTVAPSSSTQLTLSYEVPATGAFDFTVSIENNDLNEDPYNWTVSGTGATVPEMDVTRGGSAIANGSMEGAGTHSSGATFTLTYDITNNGAATLNLTTPVAISAQTNCTVVVTTQPGSSVAVTNATTLVLSVTPGSGATFSFSIAIPNDDPNENPYNWTVNGGISSGGGGSSSSGNSGGGGGGCSSMWTSQIPFALLALFGLVALGFRLRKSRA